MKLKTLISLSFFLMIILFACSKATKGDLKKEISHEAQSTANNTNENGATQISGVGYWDATDGCNSAAQGAAFALTMTGDLEGCLYVFVDEYNCSPSGTYREVGREKFVGTYNGQFGAFWTTYKFEAKYEGCSPDGSYLGLEILGRCQHPVVPGSGTGVFDGVSGRLDLKDDIEAGNYPFRGHLRF
jgi:hypothetical protein